MWQGLVTSLEDLWLNVRAADVVDVAIIAVVFYSALIWFKETASRRVLIGVLLLAVVYLLARQFDMVLTSFAFSAGFAVLLIVLVVVFQEELRRAFERLAGWGGELREIGFKEKPRTDIDMLVESAFHLAGTKTGALMVLKGHEPLDRHTEGGIELLGQLSKPLLYSLFDPHSAGHDGAVIVDENQVDRFGVHLPISKNIKAIGSRGTRHSAALGLSECSDAIVIVVSEERGVVSVAQDGKLSEMSSAAQLKRRLGDFLEEKFPAKAQPVWRRWIAQHPGLKILAILLAMLAWFTLAYNVDTVQRTFVVPIVYRNPPKSLKLDGYYPTEARLTLSASDTTFRFLDPATLKISVDLSPYERGAQRIVLTEKHVNLPPRVSIYRIDPGTLSLLLSPENGASPRSNDSRVNGSSRWR